MALFLRVSSQKLCEKKLIFNLFFLLPIFYIFDCNRGLTFVILQHLQQLLTKTVQCVISSVQLYLKNKIKITQGLGFFVARASPLSLIYPKYLKARAGFEPVTLKSCRYYRVTHLV